MDLDHRMAAHALVSCALPGLANAAYAFAANSSLANAYAANEKTRHAVEVNEWAAHSQRIVSLHPLGLFEIGKKNQKINIYIILSNILCSSAAYIQMSYLKTNLLYAYLKILYFKSLVHVALSYDVEKQFDNVFFSFKCFFFPFRCFSSPSIFA